MEDRIAHQRLAVLLIRVYGAVLSIAVTLLAGCATGYHREGFAGGYLERQIGENTFQVLFRGNAYVEKERAADFSLLRSSEVALENGYKYFVIADVKFESNTTRYSGGSPPQAFVSSSRGDIVFGDVGTMLVVGAPSTVSKTSAVTTIRCFKEKPQTDAPVVDAEVLLKALKQKYGINSN